MTRHSPHGLSRAFVGILLIAALAGCGGGPDGESGAAATPTPDAAFLTIEAPQDGATVRATSSLPGSHRAKLDVSGSAAPNATILLSGGCDFKGCDSAVRAGEDGKWVGQVWVLAPADKPTAVVLASPSASLQTVVKVRVRLRGAPREEATATPEPKRSRRRRAPTLEPEPAEPAGTPTPEPAEPVGTPTPAPVNPAGGAVRRLALVGDSLGEGIEPLLPSLLAGWEISADALTSRPLATGMSIVERLDLSKPTALAISLFTNDDPRNVAGLERAVRTSVRRVSPDGCAIWATIVRPPVNGVSYRAANERLKALQADASLAGRLVIVPWAAQVAQHPEWLASDGVHATPDGYRARAQMYAQAALGCSG